MNACFTKSRRCLLAFVIALLTIATRLPAGEADLRLAAADAELWPGEIKVFDKGNAGTGLSTVYRRSERPEPAKLRPIPRLASLTQGPDGIYFCSGLDAAIFRLRNGAEELIYHNSRLVNGVEQFQIRHVEYCRATGRLHFSVVNTPQNNAPLDDGVIYALNLQSRQTDSSIPVRQIDVEKDWWGDFTIAVKDVFVSTRSAIYRREKPSSGWGFKVFYRSQNSITTIAAWGDSILYADPDGRLHRVNLANRTEQPDLVLAPTRITDLTEILVGYRGNQRIIGVAMPPGQQGLASPLNNGKPPLQTLPLPVRKPLNSTNSGQKGLNAPPSGGKAPQLKLPPPVRKPPTSAGSSARKP